MGLLLWKKLTQRQDLNFPIMESSINWLRKCVALEPGFKYENRAVFGGLQKIIPVWETKARTDQIAEEFVQQISELMAKYPESSIEERANIVRILLKKLTTQSQRHPDTHKEQPPISSHAVKSKPDTNLPKQTPKNENQPFREKRLPISKRGSPEGFGLDAPLTVIPGIGFKIAQSLNALNLFTLEDLLYYFPRRYDDYSKLKPINSIWYGEELTIIGSIQSIESRPIKSGKMTITEAALSDGTGTLRLIWFNQGWMTNKFSKGSKVVVAGRVDQYLGRLVMTGAEIEMLEQEHLHTNRIVPVYSLTAKISQRWLRKTINQVVSYWSSRVIDFLPDDILEETGLPQLSFALQQAHFPDSQEQLREARNRLAFDEIFLLQLGVLQQKQNWQSSEAKKFIISDDWLKNIIDRLPFELTVAQKRVLEDIRNDLITGKPMNRLIQGDVGSGKTIVAALVIAIVANQYGQSAFMAPTSILAEQHYKTLMRLFSESLLDMPDILRPDQIRLLIGATPEQEKQEIREGLLRGEVKLVIGTHAILEDPVQFQDLQLAIIDEQHRFGVAQRAALRSKGTTPHLLVMTATPIPRSLALSVYGDLDLSVIDQLPSGRKPIETFVLTPVNRERAYQLIRNQVEQSHQAYIIYPLITQSDNEEVKAAVEEHARLKREIFPNYEIGLLHGKLRPDEKEEVMTNFRDGKYQILVSTSVVEVGVDVPNATVMLVEGANRFGLAQLHQFRGRVGRGQNQSFCLLIPDHEDAVENKRLATMAETNDGFVLAERDLEQRGPGDFLGTRQAGFMELKMANLMDINLIEKARTYAMKVFEKDPDLSAPEHKQLKQKFDRFWKSGKGDIS